MIKGRFQHIIQLNRKDRIVSIIIFTLVLIGFYFIPESWLFDPKKWKCLHLHFLGFQCPFCGGTRAIYKFLHGDVQTAITYNWAVLILFLAYIAEICHLVFSTKTLLIIKRVILFLLPMAFFVLYIYRIISHFLGK